MDRFLQENDDLAELIQTGAEELFRRLSEVDVDKLGLPDFSAAYFKSSHATRLFFSIETSAHLLYRSIQLTEKKAPDIILMDYGAGVGTLYLLAKLIGCKQVIYNDHLEDWRRSAELIAEAIGVHIDIYIVGDIDVCLEKLDNLHIRCDIITSRNVIEHIYKLGRFYQAIHAKQPGALIFSSTTANKANPASVIKHILWHRKWEKVYNGKRRVIIERLAPEMDNEKKMKLARATRGLASTDLTAAIKEFAESGKLPNPKVHGTNTCEPANGVWAEHLISAFNYRKLINENLFSVTFVPGFWDTHYKRKYKNMASRFLNRIIRKGGKKAMSLAPFIYVIARVR